MRKSLINKKRLVIKIGTSSLTYPNGRLNFHRIEKFANVLSAIHKDGRDVILVSSGSIAVGAGRMGMDKKPQRLAEKQALAAIGQAELIKIYQKFFDEYDQFVAQVLLTKDGIINPVRRNNARNTLKALTDMNIIPIINENDTVATQEIEFGDNDTLSADVAVLAGADLLIMLSDIDGLYSSDPRKDPNAKIIPMVMEISNEMEESAKGAGTSFGTGGMVTKITAAKVCRTEGIDTVIINGNNPDNIYKLLSGEEIGTLFVANGK
ncbi:MAG: glutamate 5-kinase [Bacteroidales bacterium]|nr:glutamate 5-kinase [Bacteroidales bacterium]